MESLSGQSFIPSNLGHVDDEEMISTAHGLSQCVSLKVEYTLTKVTRDVESLLFGCNQDKYSTIGPNPLLLVEFEDDGGCGNCAGHHTVSWIKGGHSLTSLITVIPHAPGVSSLHLRDLDL
ncbi:hypothetical protein TNCV_517971 [Trichonephila clavipes]|nr:hypothetical protein TNCV_517971 [Trichonephila clavipes]